MRSLPVIVCMLLLGFASLAQQPTDGKRDANEVRKEITKHQIELIKLDRELSKLDPTHRPQQPSTPDLAIGHAQRLLGNALAAATDPNEKARLGKAMQLLESTPATIIVGKLQEAMADTQTVTQGPLTYRVTSARVVRIPERNDYWLFALRVENTSEKENVVRATYAGKFKEITLTDDTKREYVLRPHTELPNVPILVPGHKGDTEHLVLGRPSEKAKEFYLTLPPVGDQPGIKFTIPAAMIQLPKK